MKDGIIQKVMQHYNCDGNCNLCIRTRELIEAINNLGYMTDTAQGIIWIEKSRLIGDNQ